jgi:hypothetical protein
MKDFYRAIFCKQHLIETNWNEKNWIVKFKIIHVMLVFHKHT